MFDSIPAETYYTSTVWIILGAIPVLYVALAIGWNKWVVPKMRMRGRNVDSWSQVFGNPVKFGLVEDNLMLYKRKESDDPNKDPNKRTAFEKFATLRTINWVLIFATLGLILAKNENFWIPAVIVGCIIWFRSAPIMARRKKVTKTIYDVAAKHLSYPRAWEATPQRFVKIKTWQNNTEPKDITLHLPTSYNASNPGPNNPLEEHFSSTITNDNSWLFDWKPIEEHIAIKPVPHLPKMASYAGSDQHPWNIIPIGIGTEGEVTVDVTQAPHILVAGGTGAGKAEDLSTFVFTPSGPRQIKDLQVGDELFDPSGKVTRVTHLHPIITPEKAFEVEFRNGEKIVVDGEHLWETETRRARISRFRNVANEEARERVTFLPAEVRERVETEHVAASAVDTISIAEVAELTGKHATSNFLYDIARIVGPAEEVSRTIFQHYDAQVVKSRQTVTVVDSDEFIRLYNSRRNRAWVSEAKPLTRGQFDKLRQLENELRDSDVFSAESLVEYLGAVDHRTVKFITDTYDTSLPAPAAVKSFREQSTGRHQLFPDQIFSIESPDITGQGLASLLGVPKKDAKNLFGNLALNAESARKEQRVVEQVVSSRTVEKQSRPYMTYPKRLFLGQVLAHDARGTVNDQQGRRVLSSVKTTKEIADTLRIEAKDGSFYNNHTIRRAKALELPQRELPITPYALGAWLGDGDSHHGTICGIDGELFDYLTQLGYVEKKDLKIRSDSHPAFQRIKLPLLHQQLREQGLLASADHRIRLDGDVKHIPTEYLTASVEQRRELLRGLLDTDGTVASNGSVEFATSNERLRDDVKVLVASLGYIPYIRSKNPSYMHLGEKKMGKVAYTVAFQADPQDRLFHLERKNAMHAARFTGERLVNSLVEAHQIVAVREVPAVPMRCLSVDSEDRLFLVGQSMIPTHNSVLQRNIIFHCIQHNDMWRFFGIDLKRVELTQFKQYTQTVLGVGANMEDGLEIVRYVWQIMMTRYEKMEQAGVNNFKDLIDPETGKPDYAIMLMIDEAGEFMQPKGIKTDEGKMEDEMVGEAVGLVASIARLGRAAGIHIVLATQRPDATIIKGELKANLAVRIAAGRMQSTPSIMVLDHAGAMRLPPIKGRGLVQIHGRDHIAQGYFAEASWIDNWLKEHPGVEPSLYPAIQGSPDRANDRDSALEEGAEELDFEDGTLSGEVDIEMGDIDRLDDLAETVEENPTPAQPVKEHAPAVAPAQESKPIVGFEEFVIQEPEEEFELLPPQQVRNIRADDPAPEPAPAPVAESVPEERAEAPAVAEQPAEPNPLENVSEDVLAVLRARGILDENNRPAADRKKATPVAESAQSAAPAATVAPASPVPATVVAESAPVLGSTPAPLPVRPAGLPARPAGTRLPASPPSPPAPAENSPLKVPARPSLPKLPPRPKA